jgi:hypothetical protein
MLKMVRRFRRLTQINCLTQRRKGAKTIKNIISHRLTQTDTDFCSADFAGQKQSLLRKNTEAQREQIQEGQKLRKSENETVRGLED